MSMKKNFNADHGTTFDLAVRIKDNAGVALDLTGYTATFTLHGLATSGNTTYSSKAYFTREDLPGADGWINVHASDEETSAWHVGRNAYVLDLEAPNGDVERILYGVLEVRSPLNG